MGNAEPNQAKAAPEPPNAPTPPAAGPAIARAAGRRAFIPLRGEIGMLQAVLLGVLCVALCGAAWYFLTHGEPEERILSPTILPSPQETFASFHSLWFDRALTRNAYASLRRVVLGFGLAVLVGVPVGVLCGCFASAGAFFSPLTLMGRNIPVAALIPLTFSLFGIGEFQKIMFIFIACVAFVVFDTAGAIADISSRYVDTAYTLGANRRQIIFKVLFPLALPRIFNSQRLLFGLAFGYIMLAELVSSGDDSGGLGYIINSSQRRGMQSHILLVLMIIPLVALAIDRMLFWVQKQLFPYQYGGDGLLHRAVKLLLIGWDELKSRILRPGEAPSPALPDRKEPT